MKINSLKKTNQKNSSRLSKILIIFVLHVGAMLVGSVGAWAYSWSPAVKWSGTSVSYNISSTFAASFHTAMKSADATWDKAGSKFRFNYSATTTRAPACDGYNDILPFNQGNTGKMAVTSIVYSGSTISESDTIFNTYYNFTTVAAAGSYDVQNIMTHEFGHWLWLNDVSSPISPSWCLWASEATMCAYGTANETRKRTLSTDDTDGIKAIYGI